MRMRVQLLMCLLFAGAAIARPLPLTGASSPTQFYTNLAARMLERELRLDLNRIQIYPTNQYSPEVHRLLQLTANIYDVTTNRTQAGSPYPPSVFRPVFTNDGGSIFITSYAEETGTNVLSAPMRDVGSAEDRAALQPMDMVYGVPVIIGARKGFPGFNRCLLNSQAQILRSLRMTKMIPEGPVMQTNLFYRVALSNYLGVSAWNPYTNSYPRPLSMSGVVQVTTVLRDISRGQDNVVTVRSNLTTVPITGNFNGGQWWGWTSTLTNGGSFAAPAGRWDGFLPLSYYIIPRDGVPYITNNLVFPPHAGFPDIELTLDLKVRLSFALVDTLSGRLVDYVNLDGLRNAWDISGAMTGILWDRTRYVASIDAPTEGVRNQIRISMGELPPPPGVPPDYLARTAAFRDFMQGRSTTVLEMEAPLTATCAAGCSRIWEANDPLLHHIEAHLVSDPRFFYGCSSSLDTNVASLSCCYKPWGVTNLYDKNAFEPGVKDPGICGADDWKFPAAQRLDASWLGRIHRGTPWQTVFLKSKAVDMYDWCAWMGWSRTADLSHPTNDWRFASWFASITDTNDPRRLLSINENRVEAWRGILDGLTVLTNVSAESALMVSSNSPEAGLVAGAIGGARHGQPSRLFWDAGDIFATPALSLESPWFAWDDLGRGAGFDEACEILPARLLSLVRADSICASRIESGAPHVWFGGCDGYSYAIESSADLSTWTAIATNSPVNGVMEFVDVPPVAGGKRFYRSVLLP